MSYARFGYDGSDVYVYLGSRLVCCGCALATHSQAFTTTTEMIAHLAEHRAASHVVPADVVPALQAERHGNDLFIATGDERYLDGICGEPGPAEAICMPPGRYAIEVCMWPKGHRPRIYPPGVARDGGVHEIAHSWAEPPLWPPSTRVGEITEAP